MKAGKPTIVRLFAIAAILLIAGTVAAEDWPCYRGTDKDGITSDTIDSWPPVKIWEKTDVGEGFSQVTVSAGQVYTAGWASGQDTVYCFSEASAGPGPTQVWAKSYARATTNYGNHEGTRATPTVDTSGIYVYMFSHGGQLSAFEKVDGDSPAWSPVTTTWGRNGSWGFASSPLIEGNLVIVNASGGGVAYNKTTGVKAWPDASTGQAGYATPYAVTRGSQRTIIIFASTEVVGINPSGGGELWSFPWVTDYDCNAMDPIIDLDDDELYISSAYNKSRCAKIDLSTMNAVFGIATAQPSMANYTNCAVKIGEYIYGVDDTSNHLKCIRWSDGGVQWEHTLPFGDYAGSVIGIAGGTQLLALTTSGDLRLFEADPDAYVELQAANDIVPGKTWTAPVLANGKLYIRSQQGTLACFDVSNNAVPVANNDSDTTNEDSGVTIDVTDNDTDADLDTLTVLNVTQGSDGAVVNNTSDVTYTPDADFNGSDSFTYTVTDGKGGTDTATVSVTVNAMPDAPVAYNDSDTTDEDVPVVIDVLDNDTDAENDTLSVQSVTQGSNGTVANNTTDVTYTPDGGYSGSDSFTYTVSDGNGGTDTATVNVSINAAGNTLPVANTDSAVTNENAAVVIDVLDNDTDADLDSLTVLSVTQGSNGTVANNTTDVTYTPNGGYSGSDSFTYTVSDGNGGTDTATVNVTVNAGGTAPTGGGGTKGGCAAGGSILALLIILSTGIVVRKRS
ncbi:Ig-like domain-containing protein [Planctomycetota bacterium]